MHTHIDKAEKKSRSQLPGEKKQQNLQGDAAFSFTDNRPEAISQRKLQEQANNSPQVRHILQLQAKVNAGNNFDEFSNASLPIQLKLDGGLIPVPDSVYDPMGEETNAEKEWRYWREEIFKYNDLERVLKKDYLLAKQHGTLEADRKDLQARNNVLIKKLAAFERRLNLWFSQTPDSMNNKEMLKLVEQVQQDHQEAITLLDELYRSDDEPPTWEDFGVSTGEHERTLSWYWDQLRDGSGLLKIDTGEAESSIKASFPPQIKAMYARLLSVPSGRVLLHEILTNEHRHTITITPRHPGEYRGGPAYALPHDSTAASSESEGSASSVMVGAHMKDTELTAYDEDKNKILEPAWVVLGHELIHALHIARGEMSEGYSEDDEYFAKKEGKGSIDKLSSVWDDKEEELTIDKLSDEQVVAIVKSKPRIREEVGQLILIEEQNPFREEITMEDQIAIARKVVSKYYVTENDLREQVSLTHRKDHSGEWIYDKQQLEQLKRHGPIKIAPPVDKSGYTSL